MSRRMIDPQTIIKSQIVDDKQQVDLNEILEKYGTQSSYDKFITLQIYSQIVADDGNVLSIECDTDIKGYVLPNTAITINKYDGYVCIAGTIVGSNTDMNLISYIMAGSEEYENGIILHSLYSFDVHVIKV